MSTSIDTIDPLADVRWKTFVEWHPEASVFHHPSWLQALRKTYGFRPFAFTTAHPGEALSDGLLLCPVDSWVTGKRWISLPFSDHCDLLAGSNESRKCLLEHVAKSLGRGFEYAELRSTDASGTAPAENWRSDNRFLRHSISLRPSKEEIFQRFHKSFVQRKIRRAEREGLRYVSGRSGTLLDQFYDLVLRTRRRQRVPPQSFRWFQNLASCMEDRLSIHIAFKERQATAGILTLTHRNTLTYKYGCSDERFNNLGGTPFLFWNVIQSAKDSGLDTLDLGRSEVDNEGLILFKERLGATPSRLTYWTYTRSTTQQSRRNGMVRLAQHVMPRLPAVALRLPRSILAFSGSLFYRHLD